MSPRVPLIIGRLVRYSLEVVFIGMVHVDVGSLWLTSCLIFITASIELIDSTLRQWRIRWERQERERLIRNFRETFVS